MNSVPHETFLCAIWYAPIKHVLSGCEHCVTMDNVRLSAFATRDARVAGTRGKAPMMFIVTGASGSGKSACLPGLRATFPSIDWRDFDEFGVPSPCPRGWRPRTTQRWLQVGLNNHFRGQGRSSMSGRKRWRMRWAAIHANWFDKVKSEDCARGQRSRVRYMVIEIAATNVVLRDHLILQLRDSFCVP